MEVQPGKEELGLLSVEAGVEATGTGADAAVPRRFGNRAVVAAAGLLFAGALASAAVAAAAIRRRGANQGPAKATPAVSGTAKLFGGESYAYDPGYNVHHVGRHGAYVTTPAYHGDVHHVVYETAPTHHSDMNYVYHEPAPAHVYHSDSHFVTEVHHDSLPVYHGDAYHGSYNNGGGYHQNGYHRNEYTGYHYHTYYSHHTLAWWQGAGLWWAILVGILLVFSLLGCYYYGRPRGPVTLPAPPPPPEERTRMCS